MKRAPLECCTRDHRGPWDPEVQRRQDAQRAAALDASGRRYDAYLTMALARLAILREPSAARRGLLAAKLAADLSRVHDEEVTAYQV